MANLSPEQEQHLVAAATVVGVGVASGACKKETVTVKNDAASGKDDLALGADGSPEPAPTVPPVADPNATAESTLDSSAFADSGGARARVDAGAPRPPFTGYAVVDPLHTEASASAQRWVPAIRRNRAAVPRKISAPSTSVSASESG